MKLDTKSDTFGNVNLMAIAVSLLVSITLMAIKFYAYHLTKSSAILSDALESIINVVASAFAMVSVIIAARPPDKSHPYGHGKIEYFSAGFEGALIILASVGIFKSGIDHLLHPRPILHLQQGLFLLIVAMVVNILLGFLLLRVGKRTGSLVLKADGKHVLTDVYTSLGVLGALWVVKYTDWLWLDGLIACLVGLNILVTGARLIRESFAGLMNQAEPQLLKEIANLLIKMRKDIYIDVHELRAWRSGNQIHIDFHLILPRDFSLECAHRESKYLEEAISEHFKGRASTLIHLDPCLDDRCTICGQSPCMLRLNPKARQMPWSVESMTSEHRHL